MRTTVWIRDDLLKEAGKLSGVKTIKGVVELALEEYIRRKKLRDLLALEGKSELAFDLEDLRRSRKSDVPR